MNNKFLFLFAGCFSGAAALFAQAGGEIGMPELTEVQLKGLVDKPAVIASAVKDLGKDAEGSAWFSMFCDTQMVSSVPVEKIYAALNDFPNYRKTFGNDTAVVRTTEKGKVVKSKAGKLGVTVTYVYEQVEPVNKPDEHLIVKTGIDEEGDGNSRNMFTQYYLKTVVINGTPYTYLRNRDSTEYKSQMIGQFTVMKSKNESSHRDGLKDLVKAAAKY